MSRKIVYGFAKEAEAFVAALQSESLLPDEIVVVPVEAIDFNEVEHLMLSGSLTALKDAIAQCAKRNISLGIVPLPEQKELRYTFDLPVKKEEAIALAMQPSEKGIDLLYCNDTPVLQEAVVGDAPPLDRFESDEKQAGILSRLRLVWRTLQRMRSLRHEPVTVRYGSEAHTRKLSCVGIVALEYRNRTFASHLIDDSFSVADGKSYALFLSPRSLVEYAGYLFKALISRLRGSSLTESVGYLRSESFEIEAQDPMRITIDGTEAGETPVRFRVAQSALRLSVGELFWQRHNDAKESKESVKLDKLPGDEENMSALHRRIPLFRHASETEYAQLLGTLREEARLSGTFMTLLILATLLASLGLFINSASVIIGAMLLAPLMQPIVSLSMGILRQDTMLMRTGAKTIAYGVLATLCTAMFLASILPFERLTPEMQGRLAPTLLDLFVAIVSGIAAAYVKNNEKIASSLAGVAIAVALVPPIAVAGIGLGWGAWHTFAMAFLLFATNLAGIVLSAALTFMVLGFSPWHLAKRGIAVWLPVVLLVSIPLYSAFHAMQQDWRIERELNRLTLQVGTQSVRLGAPHLIHRIGRDALRLEVIADTPLNDVQKRMLKEAIEKRIGKAVDMTVTYRYRL